jgi:hypothetical protein
MAIDMASVYAARYRKQPDMLRAAVMGQSPDPKLDSYTALNALRLVKEADMMEMAGQAQQPTSAPSIVAQNMAPPAPPQGLAGMIPMGAPVGQMPQQQAPMPQQQAPMPQPTMQAASGGLAGMYTPEEDFAEGGIVAFQSGGLNRELTLPPGTEYDSEETGIYAGMPAGDGAPSSTALSRAQEALEKYMDFEPKEMTTAEQEAFLDRYMARAKKAGGEDIYAPARGELKTRREALAGDRSFGEGMAYLTAAGKILKGRNLAEGASEAAPAFAQQLGESRRAEQQEKRAIEQMNFALNDAERKERMGDNRGAQAALAEARKFQQDANRAQGDKLRYGADIAARTVQYSRPAKAAGAGGASSKDFIVGPETYLAQIKEEHPDWSPAKQKAEAFKLFQQGKSAGLQGAVIKADTAASQLTAKQNAKVIDKMAIWETGGEARRAKIDGTIATARAAAEAELRRQAMAGVFDTDSDETPSAAPAAAPTAKPGTVLNYDKNGKRIN